MNDGVPTLFRTYEEGEGLRLLLLKMAGLSETPMLSSNFFAVCRRSWSLKFGFLGPISAAEVVAMVVLWAASLEGRVRGSF